MPEQSANGNLKWVVTTLIAIFAGAGADRLMVESRLSAMSETIKQNALEQNAQNEALRQLTLDIRRIDENQVQNRQIIDQLVKEVDWLKKR